jgi:hypothetical protein
MAAPAGVFTIALVAEQLGEDEDLLDELSLEMEPEDGCLWVFGADGSETTAFTAEGIECLRELIAEHKRQHAAVK